MEKLKTKNRKMIEGQGKTAKSKNLMLLFFHLCRQIKISGFYEVRSRAQKFGGQIHPNSAGAAPARRGPNHAQGLLLSVFRTRERLHSQSKIFKKSF